MSFYLNYDPVRNRILANIRDLWTVETVHAFAAAAGDLARTIRETRRDYDVLIDSRAFPVQTHEVAAMLPHIAEASLSLTSGRAASVVGSMLNLLQAERTQTHPRLRIFTTMEEAEAWLATPAPLMPQTETQS